MTIATRQRFKDIFGVFGFIIAIVIGAWLINALIFRSFSVSGPSMETTMYTNDRLIVSRLPVTLNIVLGKVYTPSRGHVIVFRNPIFNEMGRDEYIVKRVIGMPGDRININDGKITIFNKENPQGFNPYQNVHIPQIPVTGEVDTVVEKDQIFVIGDNRSGQESMDSRNGLGQIPIKNVVGPVKARIFPLDRMSADF